MNLHNCEKPTGMAYGHPEDRLHDEAIQGPLAAELGERPWIASLRSQ